MLHSQASHLLKYDSTLGTFAADVKIVDDNTLSVDGKNIRIVSSRDPLTLPWKEMGIDIVIEGTGVFVDSKGAGKHIEVHPHLFSWFQNQVYAVELLFLCGAFRSAR